MVLRTLRKTLPLCPLLLSALSACQSGPAVKTRGNPGQFSLAVKSPDSTTDSDSLLASGSALKSGDRYVISLTVAKPLYLYVEQRANSGSTPLLPRAGEAAQVTPPGPEVTIPPSGFLQLDLNPGVEWIFEVASTKELTTDQVQREIEQAIKSGEREPPPTSNPRNRGEAVWGKIDGRGIGVVRFKIVHQ